VRELLDHLADDLDAGCPRERGKFCEFRRQRRGAVAQIDRD
jgi:hypothetical protein